MRSEGSELAATHVVQSHRGMVERAFAKLKKWGGLSGGSVDSIDTKEKELDCAMALQNLIERFRMNLQAGIPARAPFSADAHIITPDLEPSMKIPKTVAVSYTHLDVYKRQPRNRVPCAASPCLGNAQCLTAAKCTRRVLCAPAGAARSWPGSATW